MKDEAVCSTIMAYIYSIYRYDEQGVLVFVGTNGVRRLGLCVPQKTTYELCITIHEPLGIAIGGYNHASHTWFFHCHFMFSE